MVPMPPRSPTAFVISRGRCPGPYTRLLVAEVTGRSEHRPGGGDREGAETAPVKQCAEESFARPGFSEIVSIFGGTTEIQKEIIGRGLGL